MSRPRSNRASLAPGGVRRWSRRALYAATLALGLGLARPGHADTLPPIASALKGAEAEADALGKGIQRPDRATGGKAEFARHLVDAQVAFRLGNFADCVTLLYDVIGQGKGAPDYDVALYFMGEASYQRGDRGAARSYFQQLVTEVPTSKFEVKALERLVDLAIALGEPTAAADAVSALDRVSGERTQEIAYVRGKYALATGQNEEALHWFTEIGTTGDFAFQAAYLSGTTYVAMGDLGKAAQVFADIVAKQPKKPNERRVTEMAALALGRIYYERDQPAKAIDAYLMIDRKSDLFDDALFEVAWVYVKGKQFDRALRALELLALNDPSSQKLSTVRILEGNLRIRKAQNIHQQQIDGVFTGKADPEAEYKKAEELFASTRDLYGPAYHALADLVAAQGDGGKYMPQITGRAAAGFQIHETLPEVAASWLRAEPTVQRIVAIENDLAEIQANISNAERSIARLKVTLASPDPLAAFPTLVERRGRVREVRTTVVNQRQLLADEEYELVKGAKGTDMMELESAHLARAKAAEAFAQIPEQRAAQFEAATAMQAKIDDYDKQLSEAAAAVNSIEATGAAIRTYLTSMPSMPPDVRATVEQQLGEFGPDIDADEAEIEALHREIALAREATAPVDTLRPQELQLRAALLAALDDEHIAASRQLASTSGDTRKRADLIAAMIAQAKRVDARLDSDDKDLDQVAAAATADTKLELERQSTQLVTFRTQLDAVDAESQAIGGELLTASFDVVKTKLYDILVRADVGVIDVSWSRKEEAGDEQKRLNLEKQREVKQIKDEFREILEEAEPAPAPTPPPNGDPGAAPAGTPAPTGGTR
ncbi:MAG: tetratricopeptide repeat protein [Deltaproteobacteria bacterium]|nr:tetratricopeptide repeat protein [Deltaproteobacteria bacterium]